LPRPYSSDLRARAVEAVEAGASRREAAERYEISASAVVLWTQRWEQTGSFAAARTRSSVGVVVDFIGPPEAELHLAQAVIHLATAPKSNATYVAWKQAKAPAHETGTLAPPLQIRNAPTRLMKDLGYGSGYAYDHDAEEGFSGQDIFPTAWSGARSTRPKTRPGTRHQGAPRTLGQAASRAKRVGDCRRAAKSTIDSAPQVWLLEP
jgi:transposase-like protein